MCSRGRRAGSPSGPGDLAAAVGEARRAQAGWESLTLEERRGGLRAVKRALVAEVIEAAGLPDGLLPVMQGGPDTGRAVQPPSAARTRRSASVIGFPDSLTALMAPRVG